MPNRVRDAPHVELGKPRRHLSSPQAQPPRSRPDRASRLLPESASSVAMTSSAMSGLLTGPSTGWPRRQLSTVETVKNGEGRRSRPLECIGASVGPRGGSPSRSLSASARTTSSRSCAPSGRPMTLAALAEASVAAPEHRARAPRHPHPGRLLCRTREDSRTGAADPPGPTRRPRPSPTASEYAALAGRPLLDDLAHQRATQRRRREQPARTGDATSRAHAAPHRRPRSPPATAQSSCSTTSASSHAKTRGDLSAVRLTRCPLLEAARSNPRSCAASTSACCAAP